MRVGTGGGPTASRSPERYCTMVYSRYGGAEYVPAEQHVPWYTRAGGQDTYLPGSPDGEGLLVMEGGGPSFSRWSMMRPRNLGFSGVVPEVPERPNNDRRQRPILSSSLLGSPAGSGSGPSISTDYSGRTSDRETNTHTYLTLRLHLQAYGRRVRPTMLTRSGGHSPEFLRGEVQPDKPIGSRHFDLKRESPVYLAKPR